MKISPDWLSWPEVRTLIEAFGHAPMRFVGGAVRDSLLGIAVQDVDAATPLLPDQVMQLLAKSSIRTVPTGIAHGTVMAVINGRGFEITTLRRDVTTDGRRATVAYTDDWREDAVRRDFTMNALYCDGSGEITDFFHGIGDVLAGHVRFIGAPDERIREDALRILRFFRFLAFYGRGPLDAQAIAACTAGASLVNNLSGERISQEMLRLLTSERSAGAIYLMQKHDILQHVIPGAVSAEPLKELPAMCGKAGIPPDPILALALLLRSGEDNAPARADAICRRWKLSKAQSRMLLALCTGGLHISSNDEKNWKRQIRALGKALFIKQALLHMAEGLDENAGIQAIQLASNWQIPPFPLTGDDLILYGIKPGKHMGKLLERLEEYWEEQNYAPDKNTLLAVHDKFSY